MIGTQIGEEFNGSLIGLNGYTLEITGGSDEDGFPHRKSVNGPGRQKVLIEGGPGFNQEEDGEKRRRSVRGNTVSEDTVQVNTKVVDRESSAESIPGLLGLEDEEEGSDEDEE